MTVDVQTVSPCRQKLIISAPPDETRGPYDEVVAKFVRQGTPPGFRAGKAPRPVIERHYRAEIDQEVRRALVGKFYRKAVEQEKITVVDIVESGDARFSQSTGLAFTVTLDVAPEFKLPNYKGIPVKAPETPVTTADIEGQVAHMRRLFATPVEVVGAPAQSGDLATLDYEGTLNGRPLAETTPSLDLLNGVKDHVIELGNCAPLPPEFNDALIGAEAGATVSFKAAFAGDFTVEALRGATVDYTATLKALRHVEPLDDAALLAQMRFAKDMDALRANIREDLGQRAAARRREAVFNQIQQHLASRCAFDLPTIETAEEVNRTARGMIARYAQGGATREQLEQNREALLKDASNTAEHRLRMKYILSRVADEEKIEATDAEVGQRLQEIAYENRQPVEKIKAEIEKNHNLEALRQDVRIRKAIDLLINESKET
ncbi:MAG: trigger factor [Kiritimatiellaeota bacterium]|nr:trigger factor [Kiritimatiellota bacterium]